MRLLERTPRVHLRTRPDWQVRVARGVARQVWGLRTELVLTAAAWTVWLLLSAALPARLAITVLAAVAAGVVWWAPARCWLVARLHASRVARGWERGCRHAKLATLNDRVPYIVRSRRTSAGELLRVRMPAGLAVPDLEARAETVAAYLGMREVRVVRDRANARYAAVSLMRLDTLAGTLPLPWPCLGVERMSLWEPIPVAVDEDGLPVTIALPERNVLIGGEPGAGKSVSQSMLIAAAALDPDCDLTLLDGNQVEFAVWRSCARTFVGPSLTYAIDTLKDLQGEMDRRYTILLETGRRKVQRGDGLRLHVVAVNELAFYLTLDPKLGKEFAAVLRDLVSRGRAAGIIVVAATQRPSHDIVPTSLRDLFGFRWALRCSTRDASDTILGAGWATLGYSAATIAGDQRGVGWLLAEGDTPNRLRSYYLSDDDLAALAEHAHLQRAAWAELNGDQDDDDGPALAVVA